MSGIPSRRPAEFKPDKATLVLIRRYQQDLAE